MLWRNRAKTKEQTELIFLSLYKILSKKNNSNLKIYSRTACSRTNLNRLARTSSSLTRCSRHFFSRSPAFPRSVFATPSGKRSPLCTRVIRVSLSDWSNTSITVFAIPFRIPLLPPPLQGVLKKSSSTLKPSSLPLRGGDGEFCELGSAAADRGGAGDPSETRKLTRELDGGFLW